MCNFYSDRLKEMQILLSNSQAEPGRAVRQAQEDISQPRTSFFADIGTICALFPTHFHFIFQYAWCHIANLVGGAQAKPLWTGPEGMEGGIVIIIIIS